MKVRELMRCLGTMPLEADVLCYTEDTNLVGPGLHLRVLDVERVKTLEAEFTRLDDRSPYLKLGRSRESRAFVALCVTSDF